MRAGRLDRRVAVQKKTVVMSPAGSEIRTWETVATLWMGRRDMRAGERFAAQQTVAEIDTVFTARTHPALDEITPEGHRLIESGRIFEVQGVTQIGRNIGIEIACTARGEGAGATVPSAPVITTASPLTTNDATPSIAGTAKAGAFVQIFRNGTQAAVVAASAAGEWSYTFEALADGSYSITAKAVSEGGISAASSALALTVDAEVDISGTPVTDAIVGEAYSFTPSASGGVPPYAFSLAGGTLPDGLTLDAVTGEVSGTLTQAGIFEGIVVQVEDSE